MSKIERAVPRVSLALLLLMVARVTLLTRRRDDYDAIDTFALLEIAATVLIVVLALILPTLRHHLRTYRRSSIGVLLAYYVLGLVSALWSPNPAFSAFRAVQDLAIIGCVGIYMYQSMDYSALERRFYVVALSVMMLDFLKLIVRGLDTGYSVKAFHCVLLASSSAVLFTYVLGKHVHEFRDKTTKTLLLISLLVLVLTTSAGAIVAVVASVFFVSLLVRSRRVRALAIVGLVCGTLLVLTGGTQILFSILFPGKQMGAIVTGTGRTNVWQLYLEMFWHKPFLGYGFAIGPRICEDYYAVNAHNVVFAALLGMGIPGLSLIVYYFARSLRSAWLLTPILPGVAHGFMLTLVAAAANNLTNAFVGETWFTTTVVFAAFIHLLAHREVAFSAPYARAIAVRQRIHPCDAEVSGWAEFPVPGLTDHFAYSARSVPGGVGG